jgi:hypothetical protein
MLRQLLSDQSDQTIKHLMKDIFDSLVDYHCTQSVVN